MKIAFVIDDRYVDQLLFTIHSIEKLSKSTHEYDIFYEKLLHSSIRKIEKLRNLLSAEIYRHQIDSTAEFFDNQHISRASLIRILIPRYIDNDFLYLDVDILILKELNEIEIRSTIESQHPLGARIEWNQKEWKTSRNSAIVAAQGKYFNAGVMYIVAPIWKQMGLTERAMDVLKSYSDLGFQFSDQCVLNYLVAGEFSSLDNKFNTYFLEKESYKSHIVHFAGSMKPWNQSLLVIVWRILIDNFEFKKVLQRIRQREFMNLLEHLQQGIPRIKAGVITCFKFKVKFNLFRMRFVVCYMK